MDSLCINVPNEILELNRIHGLSYVRNSTKMSFRFHSLSAQGSSNETARWMPIRSNEHTEGE